MNKQCPKKSKFWMYKQIDTSEMLSYVVISILRNINMLHHGKNRSPLNNNKKNEIDTFDSRRHWIRLPISLRWKLYDRLTIDLNDSATTTKTKPAHGNIFDENRLHKLFGCLKIGRMNGDEKINEFIIAGLEYFALIYKCALRSHSKKRRQKQYY